jgi:RNA polymerase sigma-70 factor, ECF subfamily
MSRVETAAPAAADLRAAIQGDPEAFRVLYRALQPGLLRYLRALTGDDAEDVASGAWLQVARDIRTFTGDYDGFRGWVTTIARNRALDQARRRGRRPLAVPVPSEDLAGLPAADDTAAGGIEAVTTDAALRLIATLPPDQAEAVLLRAVVGLDAETAASVLGKRAGAVRSAAHRGLRTLASRLETMSMAVSSAGPLTGPLAGPTGGGAIVRPSAAQMESAQTETVQTETVQMETGRPEQNKGVTQPRNLALKDMR